MSHWGQDWAQAGDEAGADMGLVVPGQGGDQWAEEGRAELPEPPYPDTRSVFTKSTGGAPQESGHQGGPENFPRYSLTSKQVVV